MTEQEQRIAIAEWRGWKDCFLSPGIGVTGNRPSPMDVYARALIPDFLHDLNAIQDAAWTLPKDKRNDYMDYLHDIASMPGDYGWYEANASPSQRAEALLKTIGKWKE